MKPEGGFTRCTKNTPRNTLLNSAGVFCYRNIVVYFMVYLLRICVVDFSVEFQIVLKSMMKFCIRSPQHI